VEIPNIESFLDYYDKVHARTRRVIACIPPEKLEWTFAKGHFTLGDLVRHLAAVNRYMFAECVAMRPSKYPGHGRELADGFEETMRYLADRQSETLDILKTQTPEQLRAKCKTPDGAEISVWKWLRSMVEHEIHHRGQIYIYLAMLGVKTPPLYGLTSEQVRDRSIAAG
jgi:uncharacterized damage-inducible protein DinB